MVSTSTRINDQGEEELVISDFSSFEELVEKINEIRDEETRSNRKHKRIFVKKAIRVEEITISYPINFSNIVFEEKVEFKIITFYEDIDFTDTIFDKKAMFHDCHFHNSISFENTTFKKFVDFSHTIFEAPQLFYKVDFLDIGVFNNAEFKQEIQFLYCKLESSSYMNFQDAYFNKGIDISRSNFNFGKTSFWNINVDDKGLNNAINSVNYLFDFNIGWLLEQIPNIDNIKNDKIEEIISNEDSTIYQKIDSILSKIEKNEKQIIKTRNEIIPKINQLTSVPKKLRESMRFIKNSFSAENNSIEMLDFHKKEMAIYKKELAINLRGTGEKKKSPLISKEEAISIFGISIPLLTYIFNDSNKGLYWAFIALFTFFSLFLITTKSTISFKEGLKNIKEIVKSNPIVYGFVIFIFISTFSLHLYYLYLLPQDNNPIIWYVLTFAFISPILISSHLTRDYIILLFNKHSNEFGTNWVNGVVFTLLVSIVTFIFMAGSSNLKYSLEERAIKHSIESILYILNIVPFGKDDTPYLFSNMSILTKISLFIGKIFIGYGIYQTIQAFRKYGK